MDGNECFRFAFAFAFVFALAVPLPQVAYSQLKSISMIVGNVVNNMHVWTSYTTPTTSCNKTQMKSEKYGKSVHF